ncbi:hypothetical protein JL720_11747 [Aureococcus anophagefferens]|nr:hypothetical protein JL720_11747 [Aureococcus anophagefferens]
MRDGEWAKIDQSERPQAEHMLAYFLKTKTAATAASLVRSLASKGADAKEMFVKLAKMYGTYNDQGVSIRKQLAALSMRTLGGPTELQLELDDLSQLYEDTCGHALPGAAGPRGRRGLPPTPPSERPAELSADEAHALAACGSLPPCPEGFELSFIDGGSMARAQDRWHGPRREPSTRGPPTPARDGGDRAHANHGVWPTWSRPTARASRSNATTPTFAVSIFSEGQLEEQGYRFHTTESARGLSKFMITPAGDEVKLMTWRNLKMVYVRAVAPQPAPEGLSAAAVSEPPWPEPQPRVEAMEIFAGSGSMSRCGTAASPSSPPASDQRKAGALANNLPDVHNYGDIHGDPSRNGESRYILRLPTGVEEAELSKSSLHGPVYRDRMLAYFERDASHRAAAPAPLIAPKIAERRTLVSCLRAADEVPDDATASRRTEAPCSSSGHPTGTRVPRAPDEAARAMGIDITGIAEHDVQYVVGDGVRTSQDAGRGPHHGARDDATQVLHERSHAASVAAPLLAAPASPPLRHPTAGPNAPPLMARGLGRDANVVHAAIGHPAQDRFRDTVKGLRVKVDGTVDCAVCKISRMGIRVRIVEHDDGGEFVSNKASALYAQLGVASRPRPPERHCEAAERTNRAVYGAHGQ